MITTIDGKKYKVRLLIGGKNPYMPNEWDMLMDAFQEDNEMLHWDGIRSWSQDTVEGCPECRAFRGYCSARSWDYNSAAFKSANVGFRPVLKPLEADTLCSIADGTILQFGTLYMNGAVLLNPKNPVWYGDIPDYIENATLQIGDSASDEGKRIRWVKWHNLLVADRNILKNISWDQLQALGFTEK